MLKIKKNKKEWLKNFGIFSLTVIPTFFLVFDLSPLAMGIIAICVGVPSSFLAFKLMKASKYEDKKNKTFIHRFMNILMKDIQKHPFWYLLFLSVLGMWDIAIIVLARENGVGIRTFLGVLTVSKFVHWFVIKMGIDYIIDGIPYLMSFI